MKVTRAPVWIEWVDSATRSGWQDPKEADHPLMHCQTLGWLVMENDEKVVVALNGVFDDTSRVPFGEVVTIPKRAIVKRRKVKV